jgi:hypothetical protein
MRKVYLGEKRYITMLLEQQDDEAFTIASATYDVQDADGETVASGDCDIDNTAQTVYFLIDLTGSDYEAGGTYTAWFAVELAGLSNIIKDRVLVRVLDA